MKQYDLLASGYVSMDHVIKLKSPVQLGRTAIVANQTNTTIYYGGCGVNVANALARLGLKAMPLIRVGYDYEATGFKQFLEENQINTQAVKQVASEVTSVSYLIQDNTGEHITLFYPGAMAEEYFQPTKEEYFRQAKMGLMTVAPRQDNEEFLRLAKKYELPLVFGMKGDMSAFPKDFLEEVLCYSKLIFTNQLEREIIEQLFGKSIVDFFKDGQAERIVTTRGKEGSISYAKTATGIETVELPIFSGEELKVVDTSGSGDAFIAGFIYGYLSKQSLKRCAMLGTVLASFIIEAEGCCTNAPKQGALFSRMAKFETNQTK